MPQTAKAQDADNGETVIRQGQKYLDLNIHFLDKYNDRLAHQQRRLLHRLRRREAKLLRHLEGTDSGAYVRLKQQQFSYDSISKLFYTDSSSLITKIGKRKNAVFDSLKGVSVFIQNKAAALPGDRVDIAAYNTELSSLQQKLNYRNYLNELITTHTNELKSIVGNNNLSALAGIQKDVFYGKARMNSWKQTAEDPSKLEEKALEYLQGTEGFDQQLTTSTSSGNDMQPGMSASGLEKLGYQTKDQLNKSLQQKFGNSLSQVQQLMGNQVGDWQNKAQDAANQVKDLKNNTAQAKQSLQQARSQISGSQGNFKVNPMRGLPFWKRLEKQYNWQTARATPDGKPAMIQGAAMIGFRHTPKLSYGLGAALNIGLGQDWNHIRFSFEGLSLRSYLQYQLIYGIGLYGGYERMYKQATFTGSNQNASEIISVPNPHNTTNYNESVLFGLTKSYKLNNKWNGQIQVMYDIWWKDKGLNSPVVLRFATTSK